jgi:nucleotide-binding universal stress UspA family protein
VDNLPDSTLGQEAFPAYAGEGGAMVKTILVPLDGSALAERALPYATALARRAGAHVVLVRAILAHTLPGADPTDAQVALRKRAEAEIDATAEQVRLAGVDAETHVYYDEATAAILDAVQARQADLIVMASHGRTGLGRWIYGSVAERVLRRAPVPVLVVPGAVSGAWPADRSPRLLVPLDGSAVAEAALAPARALAAELGSEVLLLRVVEPPAPLAAPDYLAASGYDASAELAAAESYLKQVATDWRTAGLHPEIVTAVGYPPTLIPIIAHEKGADLVVMATHGRSGVARLVLGSVATAVLQRSSVPVLLAGPARPTTEAVQVAPTSPAVSVTLTAAELQLVERGLEALLHGAEIEAGARVEHTAGAERISALLARLKQAEHAPVG